MFTHIRPMFLRISPQFRRTFSEPPALGFGQAPDGVETAIVIGAQNAVLVAWRLTRGLGPVLVNRNGGFHAGKISKKLGMILPEKWRSDMI